LALGWNEKLLVAIGEAHVPGTSFRNSAHLFRHGISINFYLAEIVIHCAFVFNQIEWTALLYAGIPTTID
jgi:hypothetical protein